MRHFMKLCLLVIATFCAAFGQTGFTTQTYPVPNGGSQMFSADFNGDGKPDLLVVGSSAYILLNDGSGGFGVANPLPITSAQYAAIGDLNNDGAQDILVISHDSSSSLDTLVVLLNDGTGSFTVAQSIPLGNRGNNSVTLWDVNLDGNLDVVTTRSDGSLASANNFIETRFGDGTGNLGDPVVQTGFSLNDPSYNYRGLGCYLSSATGGDFFKDGNLSLLLDGYCYDGGPIDLGTSWLAHGDNSGNYTMTLLKSAGEAFDYRQPKTADINLDGKPDGLFISYQGGPHGSFNTRLYATINNGGGGFTFNRIWSESIYAGCGSNILAATAQADFNGDGFGDVAAGVSEPNSGCFSGNTEYVIILNGSSSGSYTESQRWALGDSVSAQLRDLVTADFNNDGRPDFAALLFNGNTQQSSLIVYTNTQGDVACAPPSAAGVNVCAPQDGGTYPSPVEFTAAGTGASGSVERMELWIDGSKVSNYFSSVVDTSVPLSGGAHTATFVEVDSTGSYIKSPDIHIDVQP